MKSFDEGLEWKGGNGGSTMNWTRKGVQLLVMGSAALAASVYVLADREPSAADQIETEKVGNSFAGTATDNTGTEPTGGVSAVQGMGGNSAGRSCTGDVAMRPEPPAMLFFGLGLIGVSQLVKRKKTTAKQS
jgi:hypothetical protein